MELTKGLKFLSAKDVKAGDKITIKDEGVILDSTKFTVRLKDGSEVPKKDYQFTVDFCGGDYTLTMNKISRDNLAKWYGYNTKEWVGKQATINLAMTPMGKNMIILIPVEKEVQI